MTGFEPRTSGIGSDRSTNWATTTALICAFYIYRFITKQLISLHLRGAKYNIKLYNPLTSVSIKRCVPVALLFLRVSQTCSPNWTKNKGLIACFLNKEGDLLKMGLSRSYFRLFYKQLTVNKCSIKVADDWIPTWVLWYQKQPLCQLRHKHCQCTKLVEYFVLQHRSQSGKIIHVKIISRHSIRFSLREKNKQN